MTNMNGTNQHNRHNHNMNDERNDQEEIMKESQEKEENSAIDQNKNIIIDFLQEKSPLRIVLWMIVLLLGIGFTLGGIYIFKYHLDLPGWIVKLEYEGEERELPLEPFLGIIMLVFGMYFIARTIKFNPRKIRENHIYIPHIHKTRDKIIQSVKTRSFASSRLIVSLILLLVAAINFIIFGVELTGENDLGCWLVLGGPSLFYPTSALGLIIAVGLIVYVLLSTALMRFSDSENFYFIEEYRFMVPWITEIPKDEVKAIRLSNSHSGPKYTWIIVFIVPTIWIIQDGFHFLLNPFAYGNGLVAGLHYIISGFVQLICMLYLLLKHQTFLEIVTDKKRYELWFSPPLGTSNLIGQIEEIFGIPLLIDSLKNQKINTYRADLGNEHNILQTKSKFRYAWNLTNIIIGLIFIAIGIISKVIMAFYAGDSLRLILFAYGIYLIVKGIKNDHHKKGMQVMVYLQDEKILYWRNKCGGYNSAYKINDISEDEFKIIPRLPKLNFFDLLFSIILAIVIGMDIGGVIYFVRNNDNLASMKLTHIMFGIILLCLLIYVLIKPLNALLIESKGLKFEKQLLNIKNEKYPDTLKAVFKFQFKTLVLRIGIIFILFFLGLLYVSFYLSYSVMINTSAILMGLILILMIFVQIKK